MNYFIPTSCGIILKISSNNDVKISACKLLISIEYILLNSH